MLIKDIRDAHYDFKVKFNKIDSENNRNLEVPEIDWMLNDAYNLFVRSYASPRTRKKLQEVGFEVNQRNTEDLKNLVVNPTDPIQSERLNEKEFLFELPEEYMFGLSANVSIRKSSCKDSARLTIRQHDDNFENSYHSKSSFGWRLVNATYYEKGLKAFSDGDFFIDDLIINYIKKPEYVHYAEAFSDNGYTLPSGETLNGFRTFEVSEHVLPEIVDLAVLIASGAIQTPDYNTKLNKLNLN